MGTQGILVLAALLMSPVATTVNDPSPADQALVEQIMTEVESGKMQPCDAMARMKPLVDKVPNIYRMSFDGNKRDQAWLEKHIASDFPIKVLWINDELYNAMADYLKKVTDGGTPEQIDKALSDAACIVNCVPATTVKKPTDIPMCQREPWSRLIPAAEARATELREKAKCDADPICVQQRAKERLQSMELGICTDVAQHDHVKGKIAKEHKYAKQAGVVDLGELQSLKTQLQELDASIERGKANYSREMKRAFQPKVCRNYDIAITDE